MTLKKALDLYPGRVGVVDGDRSFTYAQIGDRVSGLARFFQAQAIQPGDRVSILEVNSHAFLEAYYAAAGIGAILNPLNYRLAAKEIAYILNDSGTRWLVAGSRFAPVVKGVLAEDTPLQGIVWIDEPPGDSPGTPYFSYDEAIQNHSGSFEPVTVDENDVAHLYYTSGTTGRPKGVMLTHKNVCLHALGSIAELKLVDSDIWGHIAPMFHLADAWATFAATWVGGRHVMVGQFEPEAVMATIEQQRITLSNLIQPARDSKRRGAHCAPGGQKHHRSV
jgi:acyl-CoA synthetase (AMP-forming)/AMP-acid ligase II